jgi:DNA polymerase-3 subunit alpha
MGFPAVALTDHGMMGGFYQFAKAAAAKSFEDGSAAPLIKPIFGVEAYLAKDLAVKESIDVTDPETGSLRKRRPKHNHAVLLAKDEIGFANLLILNNIAVREGYYYEPRIDWPTLEKFHEGLVCMSACLGGEVASAILKHQESEARDIADHYRQVFGDDFYLEIQCHGIPDERTAYDGVVQVAKDLDIPLVATNDCHYLSRKDAINHELVVRMRFQKEEKAGGSSDGRDLTSVYRFPEFYLKSAEQMAKIFENRSDAISNTMEIVEKCNYSFPLAHRIIWPEVDIPVDEKLTEWRDRWCPEQSMEQAFLTRAARMGLKKLGLNVDTSYVERLAYELNVIFDLGYEPYFITQWRICKECKDRSIMMGPGRGSGAGSLVLFCLGITKLDPLKLDLIFERFLNPGRGPQFDHVLPIPEMSNV